MSEATLSERGRVMAQASTRARIEPLLSNLYHPKDNPDGIIDMGTAENVSQADLFTMTSITVTNLTGQHPMTKDVSDFANSNIRTIPSAFTYGEGPWGSKRLRTAMANHMNKYYHPVSEVSPQDLIFSNGITSLLDLFGFAIASPGDGILISRPSYHAFPADFGARAEFQCVFVSSDSDDQFSAACVRNYETALLEARERGICIRALLLCNPHNPLGRCYPVSTIIALMQFCDKYGLHLLADEVYALSVFDSSSPHVPFHSVLSIDSSAHLSPNHLHVLYSMSKDFACGGLRLGCLYSRNTALMDSISAISHFGQCGALNQLFATQILEDTDWTEGFLAKSRKVLRSKFETCTQLLYRHGIEYSKNVNAGFFLWVWLLYSISFVLHPARFLLPDSFLRFAVSSFLLSSQVLTQNPTDKPFPFLSLSSHTNPWEAENTLHAKLLHDYKTYITPGSTLQAEQPGWFRLVFSQEDDVLNEGFRRLFDAIGV
ncbi:unnamed protein product [Aureobasidium vineae]|uniref:Aminotransferase class I/classII large domain-containing protein n=1 Tax=Aureobasidium vineae TaxID=2773715 RepID=A0A9N8JNS9_9PEZI|nr:unnamed protein product [Aureobasidium vineae]